MSVCGLKGANSGNYKVHDLRKNFDELTEMLVFQLNRINRNLRKLEEESQKGEICSDKY
jgi:hypothetical protein